MYNTRYWKINFTEDILYEDTLSVDSGKNITLIERMGRYQIFIVKYGYLMVSIWV